MASLLQLATRSLKRNPRRSAITLTAIALGVALVVFAFGIGGGLKRLVVQQAIESRSGALQVHAQGYLDAQEAAPLDLVLPHDDEFMARLEKTPGVAHVTARLGFSGLISNGEVASMVLVQALDPRHEYDVAPGRKTEIGQGEGKPLSDERPSGAVIGRELAEALGVKLGDTLTLTAAGPGGSVNALDLEVAGITRGAALFESKRVILVPLAYAQELLGMQGKATEYAVAVHDLDAVDDVQTALARELGSGVEVSTWAEVQPFLRDAAERIAIVLRGVSFILFAIVVLGVINTMLMSVYERVSEIGTLLALGVRRRQVLALFLFEAAVLGVIGGVAGAALGFVVTSYLGGRGIPVKVPGSVFIQPFHPVPDARVAVAAVVVALLGALAAAAWPARKASLMNPVDALRS